MSLLVLGAPSAQVGPRKHGPDLCWDVLRCPAALAEERLLEERRRRWPEAGILLQQPLGHLAQLEREVAPLLPGRVLLNHRPGKVDERGTHEGQVQRADLEADAAKRPHVHVVVVPVVPHQLWRHVRRRADAGGGKGRALQHTRDAEVADADAPPTLGEKDVRALEVSMHDALGVQVPQTEQRLPQPGEHRLLRQDPLGFDRLRHNATQVPILGQGHHDVKQADLLQEALPVRYQVRVRLQAFQERHLLLRAGPALGIETRERHHLGHEVIGCLLALSDTEDFGMARLRAQRPDDLEAPRLQSQGVGALVMVGHRSHAARAAEAVRPDGRRGMRGVKGVAAAPEA
mmetsp:Transcript_53835/g.138701  ORF Transcript_53835/g.138701 Transcript_53835/m.138701 type:complete len:345 (+) Transcript_53835:289-1323(+)